MIYEQKTEIHRNIPPVCPFREGEWVKCLGVEREISLIEPHDGSYYWIHFLPVENEPLRCIWPCGGDGRTLQKIEQAAPVEPPQHRPDPTSTYVAELASHLLDSVHLTRNRIRVELERCYSTRANVGANYGGTVDYGAFLRLQTLTNKLLGDLAEQANRIDELADSDGDTVIYGV